MAFPKFILVVLENVTSADSLSGTLVFVLRPHSQFRPRDIVADLTSAVASAIDSCSMALFASQCLNAVRQASSLLRTKAAFSTSSRAAAGMRIF